MMKNFRKKVLITVILALGIMLMGSRNVNAALQANGGTPATNKMLSWLGNVRRMEATGGTLGLTDAINGTTLLSSASESNNLDIHMQKNSEYGAMAILSASAYGNPNKIASGETTTGNKTGIYMNLNKEWVSAGCLKMYSVYTNVNTKYKNFYSNGTYVARPGDAITETKGWHGSKEDTWLSSQNYASLLRAYSGSIFSYYGNSSGGYESNGPAGADVGLHPTRAVIVIGKGF